MKLRVPLYAKILLWFFLNLLVLAVLFLGLAMVQFNFGLDLLVGGPAGERLQAMTQLLLPELNQNPRSEWNDVMQKYSEAYHVKFYLFRPDVDPPELLAGDEVQLPPKVVGRIMEHRAQGPVGGPGRRGGPAGRGGLNPEGLPQRGQGPLAERGQFQPGERGQFQQGERGFGPMGDRGGGPGSGGPVGIEPPPRFMVHTGSPSRYWVLIPIRLRGPLPPQRLDGQQPGPIPMPATVLIESETMSAGGLFFEPRPWLWGALGVVVISALFWFPLVRGITRSISQMTEATASIAEGQFEVRTPVQRNDEIGSLSDAINRMAVRLSGFVTGQKRFLGDIAHELCSPIARMQVALGILEQRVGNADKAQLDDLREEVEHMSELVNELLSFSRAALGKSNVRLQPARLKGIVDRAVARECGGDDNGQVKVDVPEELRVMTEPDLLLRAVSNIVRNALRYAAHAGPITVSASQVDGSVCLYVDDCGPGIPAEALAQVFDPFYRVDSSRTRDTGGVGLGLSIVKTCVESCGGTVRCENREPKGLRVVMELKSAE